MSKLAAAALFALCSIATVASATPNIVVGNHVLLPNTANQKIFINITGGDQIQNVNFSVQIGTGTPPAPALTNVDILAGTVFASSNTGRASGTTNGVIPGYPQVGYEGTTTDTDLAAFVSANGLLATLTVDTTGFTSGSWSLLLTDTLNGNTSFDNQSGTGFLDASITNGIITIPEPASLSLMAIGAGLLARYRRR